MQSSGILLVEDNPDEARGTMRALRETNPASLLHWVRDGEAALEYLFCTGAYAGRDPALRPRLVLLDIKMPKVDGIEVLRRLKGSELRSIPVLVMISSNEERGVLKSYHLGVDGYILKPVHSAALVSYQLQR